MRQKRISRFTALIGCLLLLLSLCLPNASVHKVSASSASAIRIMPLGDSITDADYWRTMLYDKLTENGHNVEFVGSRGGHEGHWGMRVCDLAADKSLVKWLADYKPEIVMMHFGTNDCIKLTTSTEEILAAYTTLVEEMRAENPHMVILVAKIIPLASYYTDYNKGVDALIAKIDEWAEKMTTKESPITVVDQHTGFTDSDIGDGIHPSYFGGQKMCSKWFEALDPILKEYKNIPAVSEAPEVSKAAKVSEAPEVSKTPVVSEIPEASEMPVVSEAPEVSEAPIVSEVPAASGSFQLAYSTKEWGDGYSINMELKNISNAEASNWKVVLSKSDFNITNIWCAELEETSDSYIITPMSWNQKVQPGDTVSFGMIGTGSLKENFKYLIEE